MTISVRCSECGSAYELPEAMAGQTGECECGATFVIPLASGGDVSKEASPGPVNVTGNDVEPENAFAAPQVAEVSESQPSNFTDSDKAGLRNFMTGLRLIAWVPVVAIIGGVASFFIGMAIGGCDGLAAFLYIMATTGVVVGIVAILAYIFLARSPSESGARPFFHAAFWLSFVIEYVAAGVLHDVFGFGGDMEFLLGGLVSFAICSALGSTGVIKLAGYIKSSSIEKDWTGFRISCLIASAIACLPIVVLDDEETAAWVMGLGGMFFLIYGWVLVTTSRQTVMEILTGDSTVAADGSQS